MPNTFNVGAARSTFQLPPLTRQQIKEEMDALGLDAKEVIIHAVALFHRLRAMEKVRGLILDLDLPFEEVVHRAVLELWQREIGEPDRDVLTELDEIRARLDAAGL